MTENIYAFIQDVHGRVSLTRKKGQTEWSMPGMELIKRDCHNIQIKKYLKVQLGWTVEDIDFLESIGEEKDRSFIYRVKLLLYKNKETDHEVIYFSKFEVEQIKIRHDIKIFILRNL